MALKVLMLIWRHLFSPHPLLVHKFVPVIKAGIEEESADEIVNALFQERL